MAASTDDVVYEVERILTEANMDGTVMYLVKWKGYGDDECTWEPPEHFNSAETLQAWEHAKSIGDVLPDDFVEMVLARMEDRQSVDALFEDDEEPTDDSDNDSNILLSVRRPDKHGSGTEFVSQTRTGHPTRPSAPMTEDFSLPDVTARLSMSAELPPSASRSATTRPVKKGIASSVKRLQDLEKNRRAGERFRNLSEQRRYRKKAQQEPLPSGLPAELRSPAEWGAAAGEDTAHILPAVRPATQRSASNQRENSWMFFPNDRDVSVELDAVVDSNDVEIGNETQSKRLVTQTPALSDPADLLQSAGRCNNDVVSTAPTIPTKLVNQASAAQLSSITIPGTSAHSILSPTTLKRKLEALTMPSEPRALDRLSTPSAAANPVHTLPLHTPLARTGMRPRSPDVIQPNTLGNHQVRHVKPGELHERVPKRPAGFETTGQTVRAANGRMWTKGDIVVTLRMNEPIGLVKLLHVPWFPWGNQLVRLKKRMQIDIDFGENPAIKRLELATLYPNLEAATQAIGLIESFEDTEASIREFCDYLERHDVAGIWTYPVDHSFNMLLYSCFAKSFRDIGKRAARQGVSRLHVAFLEARGLDRPIRSSKVVTEKPRPSSGAPSPGREDVQPMIDHKKVARRDSISNVSVTSVDTDRSGANMTPKTPASRRSSFGANTDDQHPHRLLHSSLKKHLEALTKSDIKPDLTLQYPPFIDFKNTSANVNKKHVQFFVTFGHFKALEAAVLMQWLHQHASLSSKDLIAVETADLLEPKWAQVRLRAKTTATVLFFHTEHPVYHLLQGLGSLLATGHVKCYSISFPGGFTTNETSLVQCELLFPRASTFLITEASIIEAPEQALHIVRFFKQSKQHGWKIMFRPRIRAWLHNKAAKEMRLARRNQFTDLLGLIQDLAPYLKPYSGSLRRTANDDSEAANMETLDGEVPAEFRKQNTDQDAFVISVNALPNYGDELATTEAVKERDRILVRYFCRHAAKNAHKCRRFWVFSKENVAADSGHVHFEDPEKFYKRQALKEGRQKKHDTAGV